MIKEISYGIIPVRENLVLLLRVYDTWDFPKGKPDEGEQPLETALRELKEESGLSVSGFPWGQDLAETEPYKRGRKVSRYFLAACPDGDVALEPNPATGKVEHHGFEWVTIQTAAARVKPRLQPVVKWAMGKLGIVDEKESTSETSAGEKEALSTKP